MKRERTQKSPIYIVKSGLAALTHLSVNQLIH